MVRTFKTFLNESIGLGDLGSRINNALQNVDKATNAWLTSDFTSDDRQSTATMSGRPLHLPTHVMALPQVVRTGRITILELHKNPIFMQLSDGTKTYLTYDEFKRIKGMPAVGKVATIILQRHENNQTAKPSKIENIKIHD